MKLRAYQSEAVEAVLREFETRRSTLIVQPTGTGKTVTFAHIADRMKHLGRVKVIAHREELIFQAADKIHAVTGTSPEIEMAEFRADTHMYKRSDVVVSSVQTQIAGNKGAGRMARFDPFAFGLLIIDEAHHATASSYRKVLAHYQQNPRLKVLGVTATPDRADQQALGQVFESVAFNYQLTDAVHDGWLVPISQKSVVVRGLDFSGVRTTAGDLNGKDLAEIMEYERNLHEVASPTIEIAAGRKSLVFATSVAHAERLCEIFNRHRPGAAHWICGNTDKDERKRLIGAYSRGEFRYMVNVGVFTEGFDEPTIEVIVLARPTKSRSLFAQMIGRGTRPLPGLIDHLPEACDRVTAIAASAKPSVEIIDFVGNCGKHKLIRTTDILGGKYSDEVRKRATKALDKVGGDVAAALEKAHKDIEAEEEAKRQERMRLTAKAEYQTQLIPVDRYRAATSGRQNLFVPEPITDAQRGYLRSRGYKTDGITKRQASAIIGRLKDEQDRARTTQRITWSRPK